MARRQPQTPFDAAAALGHADFYNNPAAAKKLIALMRRRWPHAATSLDEWLAEREATASDTRAWLAARDTGEPHQVVHELNLKASRTGNTATILRDVWVHAAGTDPKETRRHGQ